MPFTIHKEEKGTRYVTLKKALHLTADGRAVDENDAEGKTILGGAGALITEEDAKKYKLDESQVVSDEPFKPEKKQTGLVINEEPDDKPAEHKKTAAEKKADKKAEAEQ